MKRIFFEFWIQVQGFSSYMIRVIGLVKPVENLKPEEQKSDFIKPSSVSYSTNFWSTYLSNICQWLLKILKKVFY